MNMCLMCGYLNEENDKVCQKCGNDVGFDPLDYGPIGKQTWGRIRIDLAAFNDRKSVLDKIKEEWRSLEVTTSQGLFPSQLDNIDSSHSVLVLVGTESSYLDVKDVLTKNEVEETSVTFEGLTDEELDHVVAEARNMHTGD